MWFIPLVDIIGGKSAPGDHESNFKKVIAIPSEPSEIGSVNELLGGFIIN